MLQKSNFVRETERERESDREGEGERERERMRERGIEREEGRFKVLCPLWFPTLVGMQ